MFRIFRHYISGLALVLFLGDLAVILGAFYATELYAPWAGYGSFAARFAEVSAVLVFIFYLGDLYDPRLALVSRDLVARLLVCQSLGALILASVGFAVPALRIGRSAFLGIFLLTTPGLLAWRALILGTWSRQQMTVRVLVLGTGQVGRLIAELQPTSARPFDII